MSVDLLTNVPLLNLVTMYRRMNATMVMLLKENNEKEASRQDQMKVTEYIGVDQSCPQRIAYYSPSSEMEELQLTSGFLHRFSNVNFTTKFTDHHLYLFSKWVIDFLKLNPLISSVKHELVPILIQKQKTKLQFGSLDQVNDELADSVDDDIAASVSAKHSKQQHADANKKPIVFPMTLSSHFQNMAFNMSSSNYDAQDIIRCFGYSLPSEFYSKRSLTLSLYADVNQDVSNSNSSNWSSILIICNLLFRWQRVVYFSLFQVLMHHWNLLHQSIATIQTLQYQHQHQRQQQHHKPTCKLVKCVYWVRIYP